MRADSTGFGKRELSFCSVRAHCVAGLPQALVLLQAEPAEGVKCPAKMLWPRFEMDPQITCFGSARDAHQSERRIPINISWRLEPNRIPDKSPAVISKISPNLVCSPDPGETLVDRIIGVYACCIFQGEKSHGQNAVLVHRKHGIRARDAAFARVIQAPPLSHISLHFTDCGSASDGSSQRLFHVKSLSKFGKRINRAGLIVKSAKAVGEVCLEGRSVSSVSK